MPSICCPNVRSTLKMYQLTAFWSRELQTRYVLICKGMSAEMVKVCCPRMVMTRRMCFESVRNEVSYHKLCRKEPYFCTSLKTGGGGSRCLRVCSAGSKGSGKSGCPKDTVTRLKSLVKLHHCTRHPFIALSEHSMSLKCHLIIMSANKSVLRAKLFSRYSRRLLPSVVQFLSG